MKNEVETLLISVGAQLGRSELEMRPVIERVVTECWFDTIASLKELKTEEDWAPLKLPQRLRTALHARLHASPAAAIFAAEVRAGANTLRRILENLSKPDLKYRKVSVNSEIYKSDIHGNAAAEKTLAALGFVRNGDYLEICNPNLSEIDAALTALPPPQAFDPFRPVFTTAAGAMRVPSRASQERQREIEELRTAAAVVTGTPRISFLRLANSGAADFEEEEGDDLLLEEAFKSRRAKFSENFQSREKLELLKNKGRKIYLTVSLRLMFPKTALLLEHYFSPSDTIGKVVATLKDKFLDPQLVSWQLSCPPKKLNNLSATLEEEGLVPWCSLRLLVDEPRGYVGHFVRGEWLAS